MIAQPCWGKKSEKPTFLCLLFWHLVCFKSKSSCLDIGYCCTTLHFWGCYFGPWFLSNHNRPFSTLVLVTLVYADTIPIFGWQNLRRLSGNQTTKLNDTTGMLQNDCTAWPWKKKMKTLHFWGLLFWPLISFKSVLLKRVFVLFVGDPRSPCIEETLLRIQMRENKKWLDAPSWFMIPLI